MTIDSRGKKQRILATAAAFALVGLALKLTDLRGRQTPLRRTGEPATMHPGTGTAALARDADRPAGVASSPTDVASIGADRGGIGREAGTAGVAPPSIGDATKLGDGTRALGGPGGTRGHARMRASREGGSLTASAVGDEASGGLGSSGLREPRAGQMAGSTPTGATDARAAAAADVAFDSGDATYGTQAQVEIPDFGKITGAAGTMSFWLEPGWQGGNQDDATLMDLGDGRLQIIKNVGFLRFEFVDDAGSPGGIGTSIAEWREGEWHQVTAVWNGNQYSLYVDGQLVSQTVHDGRVDLPKDAKLYIGSDFPEGRPVARGTIGSVDLHNRPLGPGEVAGNYNSVVGGKTAGAKP